MTNTSTITVRVDTDLKNGAEDVLEQLGITPSMAIKMFYAQILRTKSFPLNLQLEQNKPLSIYTMTKEDFDREMTKAEKSISNGEVYTSEQVAEILARKFGI